jgi:cytochrome P450
VIRCAPNDLSFIDPQVWKDVYGHKATSFVKDVNFYGPDAYGNPPGLIRADNVSHARQRKLVSNAFSDKALNEQEQLLKGHVGMLIQRLKEIASSKDDSGVDIIEWLNFTSFDIMSELAFGESLGQLKTSTYNPWVKTFFAFIKFISIGRISREWPILKIVLDALVPADVLAKRKAHMAFAAERVDKRMAKNSDRPDIWSYVTKYSETDGPTLAPSELHSNGALFMLAGTETTASLLSGLTYLLLNNPLKLARLRKEVREAFSSFEDMHMTRLSQLQYLQACIEEGLRLYPPVPIGLIRTTPKGGAVICGRWVAGGVSHPDPWSEVIR